MKLGYQYFSINISPTNILIFYNVAVLPFLTSNYILRLRQVKHYYYSTCIEGGKIFLNGGCIKEFFAEAI